MVLLKVKWWIILNILALINIAECDQDHGKRFIYKTKPAPDGHRCGICPTYFQKVCAFDIISKNTYIFDNHCIMDLHNCMENSRFVPIKAEKCLYFGNFAYVHGLKREEEDYEDRHIYIEHSKKNPDFV